MPLINISKKIKTDLDNLRKEEGLDSFDAAIERLLIMRTVRSMMETE